MKLLLLFKKNWMNKILGIGIYCTIAIGVKLILIMFFILFILILNILYNFKGLKHCNYMYNKNE